MIGRLHHIVIDCPDPGELARFYSRLIGLPITYSSDDWVVIADDDETSGVAFQRVLDHRPPRWPDPNHPQQFHVDVMVEDVEEAAPKVVELGATRLGDSVFADPAGHPFCLVRRPRWASPISS